MCGRSKACGIAGNAFGDPKAIYRTVQVTHGSVIGSCGTYRQHGGGVKESIQSHGLGGAYRGAVCESVENGLINWI